VTAGYGRVSDTMPYPLPSANRVLTTVKRLDSIAINMRIKMAVLLIVFLQAFSFSQEINKVPDEEMVKMIFEGAESWRIDKQSEILDYENLPGTFWIPDISLSDERLPMMFSEGYAFLGNNILIIVYGDIYGSGSNPYADLFIRPHYNIMNIKYVLKYDFENGKIKITDKVFLYLEDTYLYSGNDDDGYERYILSDTFSIWYDY